MAKKLKKLKINVPPKYLKPLPPIYTKKEPTISLWEKIWYRTKKIVSGIGDGLTDLWDIVETVPKLPKMAEDGKKISNNIIWAVVIVGAVVITAIILINVL